LASCKGYRNTAVFLAAAMRLSVREAKARVAHATTPMPLTGKALSAGTITVEHVTVIHKALAKAPEDLSADLLAYAEKTLVDLAVQAPPLSVIHAGERLAAYWDVDSTKPKDPLAEPKRRLTWRFDKAGQMHITGELDPETAALLTGIIEPLATSRPLDEFGREDTRPLDERQGDALAELIHLATRAPDLPTSGTERALITVTISLDELERRAGTVFIDSIGYTTISHLRRMCCEAKVIPTVLGTHGDILDLGHARRTATPAQLRALALRDRGCARPGCRRKPRHCQAHHIQEWIDNGDTDLNNLVLLCLHHHLEIHHAGWSIRMVNGVPEFIPPKWLDHEQKPIRNATHNLPHQHAA
ncbi:MAG: hypothetical protein QOI21_672, partial [Actinomycetota bacterium]|nr:hypothetical protein [Actinomycetota bacterium]